jgi:bacillithiol biosynthesis cysteine-adding enzyme BshC
LFAIRIVKEYIHSIHSYETLHGMNDIHSIRFSDLRHFDDGISKLFCDYLENFPVLSRFYAGDYHASGDYVKLAEQRRKTFPFRELIADVLTDQNREFGCGPKTLEHVELLRDERTVAVVTGQQVGLACGPLYTVYKTITAIKLARTLHEQHPEYHFIPVFWLEGEDHDFDEMNHINILGGDGTPLRIEYLHQGKKGPRNFGAVGQIVFDTNLQRLYDDLTNGLQNSEFKESLLTRLRAAYMPGTTFNQAFVHFLNGFFGDDGLVYINSLDTRLKKVLGPIFLREVEEYPRVSQLIIQQSAELEEHYHAQIKTKAMNVFLYQDGGRYALEPRDQDFTLRGTRKHVTREELQTIIETTPERLSPNVALRPICQDILLPSVAYVAGPSEIAYFAQLKGVYDYFQCPMPIIYPRASATLVEERHLQILEKFQLDLFALFTQGGQVRQHVIDMLSEVNVEEMFTGASARLVDTLGEIEFGLNAIDPTLAGPLDATREKITAAVQSLRQKASEAQQRKHDVALRQIQKVLNTLLPNDNFQERELNLLYYLNRFGNDVVVKLRNDLVIDRFHHQFISLT